MSTNKAAASLARQRWAQRTIDKLCEHCGKAFRGDATQAYCSKRHQESAAAKRWRERRRTASVGTEATPT